MVKRSTLFRFPLGTFDELGLHSPKGACSRSQGPKPARDGKSKR